AHNARRLRNRTTGGSRCCDVRRPCPPAWRERPPTRTVSGASSNPASAYLLHGGLPLPADVLQGFRRPAIQLRCPARLSANFRDIPQRDPRAGEMADGLDDGETFRRLRERQLRFIDPTERKSGTADHDAS